ncbi:MAG TPA: hypothetical protein VLA90_02965 [Actinomycetota bacterium]|nr:hypothetical protein [Actinomycetota bacterium]
MNSKTRTIGRAAAFGLLALLLSSCLKLDMDLQVSSADTVSGRVIFAVQKELLDLAGGTVEDILGTDAPLPEDVEGVSVEDYEDDEFAGQQFNFDSVPLSEFNQEEGDEQLRIVREGDRFRVTGVLDLSSGLGATGPTGFEGMDPSQFLQGAELRIRIAFPGEVIESNGQVDGNRVTWEPQVGERLEIEAVASAVGSGTGDSNLTLWLIIGAVVLVAAVVVGILLARRRTPATAGGPSEAAEPIAGEPGPPAAPGTEAPPVAGTPPPAPPPPSSPGTPPPPRSDET